MPPFVKHQMKHNNSGIIDLRYRTNGRRKVPEKRKIRLKKVVPMESQRGMSVHIVEFVQKLNKTQKRFIWLLADIAGFLSGTVLSYLFFVSLITLPIYTYATNV